MKSIRLTNHIRDEIVQNILKVWTSENPQVDLADKALALAIKAREKDDLAYPEIKKLFAEYGQTYFKTDTATMVKAGGDFLRFTHEPVVVSCHSRQGALDAEELKEYVDYQLALESQKEWRERHNKVKTEANAILNSVNTSKQLLEVWPEVEPFVTPYIRNCTTNLPAIPVDKINSILGWN